MHAENLLFSRFHTLFAYNFLMNGPIYIILGMQMGIDSQNKISFTLLQNIKKYEPQESACRYSTNNGY